MVEGQTEASFIGNVLAPELWSRNVFLNAVLIGKPGHKGGNVSFARVLDDVVRILKQEPFTYCTTMFDLYGLRSDFPGLSSAPTMAGGLRASAIEKGMKEAVWQTVPELRPERFLPHIQPFEFEGLLFSDPDALAHALRQPDLAKSLHKIRDSFPTPEDIDGRPDTAPSKRLLILHDRYNKVIQGSSAAKSVGLGAMRQECPHLNTWITRLEQLVQI